MRKFTLFILVMLMLVSNGVYSQDSADKSEDTKEGNQTQTQPTKRYDLTPKFYEDTKWKEEISFNVELSYGYDIDCSYGYIEKTSVSMKAKFDKFKEGKPKKIKYYDCNGSVKIVSMREKNIFVTAMSSEYDLEESEIDADVKDDLTLRVKEVRNIMNDKTSFLSSGTFFWFEPPLISVKVGDSWSSKKSPIKLNSITLDSLFMRYGVKLSEATNKLSLESVTIENNCEIATILSKSNCTLSCEKHSDTYDVNWEAKIKYDITNKRINSYVCTSPAIDDNAEGYLKLDISIKFTYETTPKIEEKKEPLKPKSDDDE